MNEARFFLVLPVLPGLLGLAAWTQPPEGHPARTAFQQGTPRGQPGRVAVSGGVSLSAWAAPNKTATVSQAGGSKFRIKVSAGLAPWALGEGPSLSLPASGGCRHPCCFLARGRMALISPKWPRGRLALCPLHVSEGHRSLDVGPTLLRLCLLGGQRRREDGEGSQSGQQEGPWQPRTCGRPGGRLGASWEPGTGSASGLAILRLTPALPFTSSRWQLLPLLSGSLWEQEDRTPPLRAAGGQRGESAPGEPSFLALASPNGPGPRFRS